MKTSGLNLKDGFNGLNDTLAATMRALQKLYARRAKFSSRAVLVCTAAHMTSLLAPSMSSVVRAHFLVCETRPSALSSYTRCLVRIYEVYIMTDTGRPMDETAPRSASMPPPLEGPRCGKFGGVGSRKPDFHHKIVSNLQVPRLADCVIIQ